MCVFVVNRDLTGPREVEVSIVPARPGSEVEIHTITGTGPDAVNTWDDREAVTRTSRRVPRGAAPLFVTDIPAHSVNALVFTV